MVNIITHPEGKGFEAELTDIDLPMLMGLGFGATPEEAVANLRQKVQAYIKELQQADFTILPRLFTPFACSRPSCSSTGC